MKSVYKLKEGTVQTRNNALKMGILPVILVMLIFFTVGLINDFKSHDFSSVLPMIISLLVFGAVVSLIIVKASKKIVASIEITIEDDFIMLRNSKIVRKAKINQIKSFSVGRNKEINIYHKKPTQSFKIPAEIEGYDHILEVLRDWDVEEKRS